MFIPTHSATTIVLINKYSNLVLLWVPELLLLVSLHNIHNYISMNTNSISCRAFASKETAQQYINVWLEAGKSLGALGASWQEGALPANWGTGAAPAMNSKQHCSEGVLWVPVHNCGAQGKLHMLWDICLVLSDRGCSALHELLGWGWDSPCSSSVGTHVLSHKACFQQHCSSCQVLSGATHTSAAGCTCKYSQVSQCLIDCLDSLPWQHWGTKDRRKVTLHTFKALQKLSERFQWRKHKLSFTSTFCSCQLEKGGLGRQNKITWLWFPSNKWSSVQWLLPPQLQSQTPFTPPSPCTLGAPGRACLQDVSVSSPTWNVNDPPSYRVAKTNMVQVSLSWMRHQLVPTGAALCKLLQLCISILKHSFILLLQRPAPALHKSLMKRSASSTVPMNKRQNWRKIVLPPKNQSSSTNSTQKLHLLHQSGIPGAPL